MDKSGSTYHLPFTDYNIIVVNMLPALITLPGSPWSVLPPGVHPASVDEVEKSFATNKWRRELFGGLVDALKRLLTANCATVYLDGSYVTDNPRPGDFDACWDPTNVIFAQLDPLFLQFENGRATQKAAFKGEFFPSSLICSDVGRTFLDFFQQDRFTGMQKGIVSISLSTDPISSGKVLL